MEPTFSSSRMCFYRSRVCRIFDTSPAPKIDSCEYALDLQRVTPIPSIILRPLGVDRCYAHDLSENSPRAAALSRIRAESFILHPQVSRAGFPEPPSGSLCYLPKTSLPVLISYGRSLTRDAQMRWDVHTQIC